MDRGPENPRRIGSIPPIPLDAPVSAGGSSLAFQVGCREFDSRPEYGMHVHILGSDAHTRVDDERSG